MQETGIAGSSLCHLILLSPHLLVRDEHLKSPAMLEERSWVSRLVCKDEYFPKNLALTVFDLVC